jgi:hypothetical protein
VKRVPHAATHDTFGSLEGGGSMRMINLTY